MKDAFLTIKKRYACRTFNSQKLGADNLSAILGLIEEPMTGPFGNQCRFRLLGSGADGKNEIQTLSTYGVIKGALYYLAGAVLSSDTALIDYGYCMEELVLHITDLGIGTCWIGGTFDRSHIARQINLAYGEVMPAISPVGFPADKPRWMESMMKFFTRSYHRKPWEDLFFEGDEEKPLTASEDLPYYTALESVRLAPSARNKQPWRLIKEADKSVFHFYTIMPKPEKGAEAINYPLIDIGIALKHFELGAETDGLKGSWNKLDRKDRNDWVYITTFTGDE